MRNFKVFKHVVSNLIMAAVIVTVLAVSINLQSLPVSSSSLKPINKGTSKSNVSLMINVYSGTEFIEPMLDIFERHDVKTTFFVGGLWVMQNEDMLKLIHEKGHEIGNHGYHHKDHKMISEQRNREEIEVTHNLVKDILGIDMNLFAPPSGSYNEITLKVAESMNYKSIMWTLDTIDWRDKDRNSIFSRATKKIDGGSLVLMHPTAATLDALDDIILTIRGKNLNITPVSQAL